jgi:hypothetical protein
MVTFISRMSGLHFPRLNIAPAVLIDQLVPGMRAETKPIGQQKIKLKTYTENSRITSENLKVYNASDICKVRINFFGSLCGVKRQQKRALFAIITLLQALHTICMRVSFLVFIWQRNQSTGRVAKEQRAHVLALQAFFYGPPAITEQSSLTYGTEITNLRNEVH